MIFSWTQIIGKEAEEEPQIFFSSQNEFYFFVKKFTKKTEKPELMDCVYKYFKTFS